MEIIYARSPIENKGDRKVVNPVHFSTIEKDATAVYVDKNVDKEIASAYESAGIKVHALSQLKNGGASKPVSDNANQTKKA